MNLDQQLSIESASDGNVIRRRDVSIYSYLLHLASTTINYHNHIIIIIIMYTVATTISTICGVYHYY